MGKGLPSPSLPASRVMPLMAKEKVKMARRTTPKHSSTCARNQLWQWRCSDGNIYTGLLHPVLRFGICYIIHGPWYIQLFDVI